MRQQYEIRRLVPEGWRELRWCIVRIADNEVICHRDRLVDAQIMVRQANALNSLDLANERKSDLLNGVSVEKSLSHSELLALRRVTRGESYR